MSGRAQEFHYRMQSGEDRTSTLPLIVVRGQGSIAEAAVVESDKMISGFPTDDPYRQNPLKRGESNITVHSEYYQV